MSLVLVVAFSMLFVGTSQAATQAIVKLEFQSFTGGTGAGTPLRAYTASPAPISQPTLPFVATVETGVATPSIMWPANAFTRMFTLMLGGTITPNGVTNPSTTFGGNYFSFSSMFNVFNQTATLMRSNIASGVTTVGWPASSTICNNTCLPRYGNVRFIPGARRFGGTGRLLNFAVQQGLVRAYQGGFSSLVFNGVPTAMGTGPQVLGSYFNAGSINLTNTLTAGTFMSLVQRLGGPLTTGAVRAYQPVGFYPTTITQTGSFSFNTTNLTGMISLVGPQISQSYLRNAGGVVLGPGFSALGFINRVQATFAGPLSDVPEPTQFVMLGAGAVAIGVAAVRRRRKG